MRVAYAQLSTLRTFEMEKCNCVYCCFSLALFPFADSIVPLFFFSRHPVQLLCGNDMSFCFNFHFDMIFSCLPLHRTFYFMRYQRQCLRTLWTIFVHQIWDFVKGGIELKRQNECHAFMTFVSHLLNLGKEFSWPHCSATLWPLFSLFRAVLSSKTSNRMSNAECRMCVTKLGLNSLTLKLNALFYPLFCSVELSMSIASNVCVRVQMSMYCCSV